MLELIKIDLESCFDVIEDSKAKEAFNALQEQFVGDFIKENLGGKIPASVKFLNFTDKNSFEKCEFSRIYYITDAKPEAKVFYMGKCENITAGDSFVAEKNEEVLFADASVIEMASPCIILAGGVCRVDEEPIREGKGNFKTEILNGEGFNAYKHRIKEKTGFVSTKKALDVIIITEGRARMFYDGASLAVNKGDCILVPAYIGKYTVEGNCEFLRCDFI